MPATPLTLDDINDKNTSVRQNATYQVLASGDVAYIQRNRVFSLRQCFDQLSVNIDYFDDFCAQIVERLNSAMSC